MKPYVFVKKASLSLIYTSIAAVFVVGLGYALLNNKYSADENSNVSGIDVIVQTTMDNVPADSRTAIPISSFLSDSDITKPSQIQEVDHVSIFMTKAIAQTSDAFILDDDTPANRAKICQAASAANRNDPLNLVGITKCDSNGICDDLSWTSPSATGSHRLFAVAMKGGSDACTTDRILGWSKSNERQMVNVYKGAVYQDGGITVSAPTQSLKNKDILVGVQVTDTNITKIKLFSTLSNSPAIADIHETYICLQVNNPDKSINTVQEETSITCDGGTCSETTLKYSTTGTRQLIAVGMKGDESDDTCVASGENKNIISINKKTAIKVIDIADPTGTATVTLNSPNPAPGTTPGTSGTMRISPISVSSVTATLSASNQTTLKTITDVLNKFHFLAYYFIGVIAFSGLIYAGFAYMTAGGNDKQTERAKKAMTYSLIAIVILFCAWAIVSFTVDILNGAFTGF